MTKDFTLEMYSNLCHSIKSNYKILTVKDYLNDIDTAGHVVIMRHDVDKHPERALKMAELEKDYSIQSTYYFRVVDHVFKADLIKQIEALGHEIGYHYEVLDKTDGDFEKAIDLFSRELTHFREISNVETACMHGSPMKPWRNLDIWEQNDFHTFGLLGEPYLSIDFGQVAYYTDTGRRWDGGKYAVDDYIDGNIASDVSSTPELISVLEDKTHSKIMILTHPQRWTEGKGEWARELVSQRVKNVGKRFLKRGK